MIVIYNHYGLYITIQNQKCQEENVIKFKKLMKNDVFDEEAEIQTQILGLQTRLKEEREKAHLSQMDLSLMAGLNQNQVFRIESGEHTPNLYSILKLCSALEISPAVLFEPYEAERASARDTVLRLVGKFM
jgi:ribosome-binding protein aMBF1 (putative translation factor)